MKAGALGVVYDSDSIHVRKEPNIIGEVICSIPNGSEVMIEEDLPLVGFYKICTASGIEGYCMKRFIKLKEE